MKIPYDHTTNIDDLILNSNNKIFLSGWDRTLELPEITYEIVRKSMANSVNEVNVYNYLDEMSDLKDFVCQSLLNSDVRIKPAYIGFTSNGTMSLYLTINVLNNNKKLCPLLLSPIYFTFINLFKSLNCEMEYCQIFNRNTLIIDFNEVESTLENYKANIIIINDPLFGIGYSLNNNEYDKLIKICKDHNMILLIDYIYGGMEWENNNYNLTHNYLLSKINSGDPIILIESMSKRVFINGFKNSIIYCDPEHINQIEKYSVYSVGCVSSTQVSLIRELYEPKNKNIIKNLIFDNINIVRQNYELLTAIISDTDMILSKCKSGYFCLLSIPYYYFKSSVNHNISHTIINKTDVITIPHDRYLYFDADYYCFRINLMSKKEDLIKAISALINFIRN